MASDLHCQNLELHPPKEQETCPAANGTGLTPCDATVFATSSTPTSKNTDSTLDSLTALQSYLENQPESSCYHLPSNLLGSPPFKPPILPLRAISEDIFMILKDNLPFAPLIGNTNLSQDWRYLLHYRQMLQTNPPQKIIRVMHVNPAEECSTKFWTENEIQGRADKITATMIADCFRHHASVYCAAEQGEHFCITSIEKGKGNTRAGPNDLYDTPPSKKTVIELQWAFWKAFLSYA
jgi:hypothetical protein